MSISLIICTRNRAEPLRRCLSYVADIEHGGPWEIVIVDNGSTDATPEVIREFAADVPVPVKPVLQTAQGLSNARNAGIASASGEIIFFTDDDCYVDPDILDAVRDVFADPAVGYASGRVRLYDPSDYPTTVNESVEPLHFPARRFLPAGMVKGANLAFRRRVLDQIGPFDPLFGSGSLFPSEDADAAMRASLAGWAGGYAPAMVVHHHHGRKEADLPGIHKAYDIGRGAYHAKLLGLKGGLLPALRAWAGLPKRVLDRPSLLRWELYGAFRYWSAAAFKV